MTVPVQTTPLTTQMVNQFQVRNFTSERIDDEELACLVQFIASLDVCKSCISQIPKLQSQFGSDLSFSIDFENRILDIKYGTGSVCGW